MYRALVHRCNVFWLCTLEVTFYSHLLFFILGWCEGVSSSVTLDKPMLYHKLWLRYEKMMDFRFVKYSVCEQAQEPFFASDWLVV